MTKSKVMFDKLAAPFDPAIVSWRAGPKSRDGKRTKALAYIDARDVMNRLDEVCGPAGWQSKHVVTGSMVTCHLSIKDPESGEWVSKSDGAGQTDVEGEKGSYSDALKRAAVSWGVARYLYDLDSPWVDLENNTIPERELTRLAGLLRREVMPNQTVPAQGRNNAQPPSHVTAGASDPDRCALIEAAWTDALTVAQVDSVTRTNMEFLARLPRERFEEMKQKAVDRKQELLVRA